jgi:hypothetical protein
VGLSGCAGAHEATAKQVSALQDKVAILQNERDRLDERLSALEEQQRVLVADRRGEIPTPNAESRPLLEVVRLEPPQTSNSAAAPPPPSEPESGEPRMLISGSGDDLQTSVVKEPQ